MIYFSETCGADVVVGIDMQNFNEGTWSLRIARPQIINHNNHHVILLYHLTVGSFFVNLKIMFLKTQTLPEMATSMLATDVENEMCL